MGYIEASPLLYPNSLALYGNQYRITIKETCFPIVYRYYIKKLFKTVVSLSYLSMILMLSEYHLKFLRIIKVTSGFRFKFVNLSKIPPENKNRQLQGKIHS